MIAAPSFVLDAGQWAGTATAVIGLCVLIQQVVKRTIISTAKPLIDDVKANAKQQHDDQNRRLDSIDRRLTKLEKSVGESH